MLFSLLIIPTVLSCIEIACSSSSTACLTVASTISLSVCKSSTSCEISDITSYLSGSNTTTIPCTQIETISCPLSQPTGRACCQNSNCDTKTCDSSSNTCTGFHLGLSCSEDSECAPNSYCNPNYYNDQGTCITSIDLNQDCDYDNQCAAGIGCSRGTCVQFLSLDPGKQVDQPNFCKTNLMNPNHRCDSIVAYVNDALVKNPFSCNIGDVCVYKYKIYGTVYDTAPCECDGTSSTTGFCGKYAIFDLDLAESYASYLRYTTSICSGNDGSSTDIDVLLACQSITLDQFYYLQNWTYATKY